MMRVNKMARFGRNAEAGKSDMGEIGGHPCAALAGTAAKGSLFS